MPNFVPCLLTAAALVTSATLTCAQNAAPAAPARPAATAAAPGAPVSPAAPVAASMVALPAEGLDDLRPHVGETVDITGTPTGTGHSKTGTVAYLNFAGPHKAVAVVAFLGGGRGADTGAKKVTSEDELKAFVGKAVIVHGKLADYKGDLQIVLDSLDQIRVAP